MPKYKNILPYNKKLKPFSRELRRNALKSERIFWRKFLSDDKTGFRFYRQKPIANYIADFFCPKLKLAIEIDGISHEEKGEYDRIRDEKFSSFGICTYRIYDREVFGDVEGVRFKIEQLIGSRMAELGIESPVY